MGVRAKQVSKNMLKCGVDEKQQAAVNKRRRLVATPSTLYECIQP